MNVLRDPGEKDRRLSGRVTSSDDDDFFIRAELRLQTSGAIVDAYSFKLGQV